MISGDNIKRWFRERNKAKNNGGGNEPQDQFQLVEQPSNASSTMEDLRRAFKLSRSRNGQALSDLREFQSDQDRRATAGIEIATPNDFELISKRAARPPRALRQF